METAAGVFSPGTMKLYGRRDERTALGRLLAGVRDGHGGVLVLRGEAGVGKTALLDDLAEAAQDLRVIRAAGAESELDIAFAALHQLCAPALDRLEHLPGPQRDALSVTFGRETGPAPDRFLIGVAALGLLTEAAAGSPLVCVIDDAQWLDRETQQALAFAARRLLAGPGLMVFATREPLADLSGLPELEVTGLREADARALLASVVRWPLDDRVRDRIVAETRGNPLELLTVRQAQPTAGLGLLDAQPLPGQVEPGLARELDALPALSRRLLVIAAAEPAGDPALVWRAATRLGVPATAARPVVQAGLVAFGARVAFRHPLVRSAAYRSVPLRDRQHVHRVLAEATDPRADPDHRAWHLAQAASEPDELLAAELEQAAGRARARGVLATAAAFGEHATTLTLDPARRTGRALAGARDMVWAGACGPALDLLALAESGPLDAFQRARATLVRAQIAFVTNQGGDAPPRLLLEAARQLKQYDTAAAHAAYLDAMHAAMLAGHLAHPGATLREVTLATPLAGQGAKSPDPFGILLDGLAMAAGQGIPAAMPVLRRALGVAARAAQAPADQELRWLRLAGPVARHAWDDQAWDVLSGRYLRLAREAGALSELPAALSRRAYLQLCFGELATAAALADEVATAGVRAGGSPARYAALGLAAVRGRQDEARALIDAIGPDAAARGEGTGVTAVHWASAVLSNGLGRYADALAAASQAGEHADELGLAAWSRVELIEAAVRAGQPGRAAGALRWLAEITSASGTDWALGVQARSRALLSEGEAAEDEYLSAIARLGRTRVRLDLARAHLLYGEWLRRENRRVDAREQLRRAHQMLQAMGAEGFAERARRELMAAGQTLRKRTPEAAGELTAQELQIVLRAREGRTNAEIGAELFLSPRTIEWHMSNVFAKLGITSRRQLWHPLHGVPALTTPLPRAARGQPGPSPAPARPAAS
jgi:DNA-binding CsgD family transcriptional regulator